ncbi:MAG: DUF512 domain-containing protein [Lachnospiraceae bacterium]|nr:DUF512 domain-containing protein [Lachnospiraceae bacterium]
MTKHLISQISKGSIAEGLGITSGDFLLSINDSEVIDVFDYRYLCQDKKIKLLIETKDGEEKTFEIIKDEDEELGLEFDEGLMDEYRHCSNKCIFCFIDQMPKGMRETLYFKDDDMRLSFLQGNYVTLTNLSDKDVERIIKYRLEPINISFQTTNKELRCKMLNNRFAGEALKKADTLYEAAITMNGQIVLCKGVNDGEELERSLRDLYRYVPVLESLSVVPVGLSKYRDGLYPLEPFEKEDAREVLKIIHKWQDKAFKEHGIHFVHASDEWYILAEQDLPEEERYDGYLQIENGVGMLRSLIVEFEDGLEQLKEGIENYKPSFLAKFNLKGYNKNYSEMSGINNISEIIETLSNNREISVVTGRIAYPYIKSLTDEFTKQYPNIKVNVFAIKNEFFGERITVTGLITGQDIIKQLDGKKLGETLLIPENMLRASTDVFLDDTRLSDIEKSLHISTAIVKSNGRNLIERIIGKEVYV